MSCAAVMLFNFINILLKFICLRLYLQALVLVLLICVLSGIILGFLATSSCVTMVIAIERCLCVLFPLHAQTLISTRIMAIILLTTTVLLHLGFAIFPLRMTVKGIVNSQTGQSLWIMVRYQGPNQVLLGAFFVVIFDFILLFAMNIITVSVTIICTAITVAKLKLAIAWRFNTGSAASSEAQTQQTALTKMLVVMCCVHVVCSTPGFVMALVRRIQPEYGAADRYANIFALTHAMGYRLFSATNSSVNFFVYYSRSSRFRKELRGLGRRKPIGAMKG